ncbi:hypothetical protein [Bacillus sp. B15-48]|uniref:hypothetical protein n=1 Tax=Bacillus sp. B15-48 TaxID=1548601 RepID=UPI00193F9EF6|nr:hypothetical protein [Bacillus sp. B15-48]MBM4761248.1 hypothetical protein [Bacillus sp. B15-48]
MMIEPIEIEYSLKFETDLNIINGSGRIYTYLDDEYEEETSIGHLSFNYYNGFELGDELLLAADAVSGDELYMVNTLLENDFEYDMRLVTLDQITINKQFYTEELEKEILESFIQYCKYMMLDYLLVIATNPQKGSKQGVLEFPHLKLYKEFGFENIGGSENQSPVMLKSLGENFYEW